MDSEWPLVQLKDVVSKLGDGLHGTPKYDDSGEYYFINGNNLDNGFISIKENTKRVSYSEFLRHKKILNNRTILVSINGTLGNFAYYRNENVVLGKSACYFNVKEHADKHFVRYVIADSTFQNYIEHHATGTTIKNVSLQTMREFTFRLPPKAEQRAIAHILGTLDDKIELNRQRNQTLEAMARALFQDWFVDFGPVRAKMEKREPYLPPDLWSLFPDSLDDEGKPEGWETWKVRDIGDVVCGKTPSTKVAEYYGDEIPFITIPEMHGKIFASDVKKRLSRLGADSQQKKMLPPGSICVSCIATPGLVVITTEASQTNQQINSVIPNEENTTYFWYWVLRDLGEDIRASGSGGSVLSNLSTGRFSELRVPAGTVALRHEYNTNVNNIFEQILIGERESKDLANLRDTLLPKLISGELRVNDAERFLERTEISPAVQQTRNML